MYKNLQVFCLICSLCFISCKKDDNIEAWISAAQDYALAEAFLQEIFKIVDEAAKNQPGVFKLASLDCATITLEADTSGDFPKTLHIDYGLVNCIGSDGRKRRGVIKATFNNPYSESGTVVNISFEKFFMNNYGITANNVTLTNTSTLIQIQHHLNFPGIRFLNSSGQSIMVNGSRTFKLISGDDTQGISDDIFNISGSLSGTDRLGTTITATITETFVLNYECRSIVSGLLNLKFSDVDGIFNYGDGECNDNATVTIDGRPFYINLE